MDRLAAGHLKADVSESHLDISLERITAATKGPIAQGYEFCRAMLRLIDSSSESPIEEWREVNARLATWAADFEVEKGTLDRVFVDLKQSPLLEATCIALLGLCRTLIDYAVYRKKTSAHKMKSYLADFEKPFLNAGLIHAPSNIDSDDNSETDEDVSVEDVKDYIDSLFDLAPSTEEVLHIHEQPDSSIQPRVEVISSPQVQPSQPSPAPAVAVYHRLILEKFPGIPEALAGNFASVNWIRRQRVQGFIQQAPNEESKQIQHRTAPSNTFKDSGMGTSIFTFETAQNEVSGIPLPVNYARSERSMTSFGTTHSTYSGKVKLPKPPTKLRPGVVFECSICYSTLSGVDTKMLWKKHVLKDLQPYSCIFEECPDKHLTFSSRRQWQKHEWQFHRPQYKTTWKCIACKGEHVYDRRDDMITHLVDGHMKGQVTERDVADIVDRCEAKSLMDNFTCPFCHEIIPETRISLQKHVGTHMDEIALKVLPQDIDSANDTSGDDDDDSNSEASVSPRGDDTDRSISRPPEDVEVPSTHAGQSSEEFFVCPWPDCQDELNLNKYIQCFGHLTSHQDNIECTCCQEQVPMFDILDHLITHEQKGLLQRQHMPGILLRLFQRALLNRLLMNLIKGQDPTDGGGGGMMKDISSLCRAPEISNLHGVMQRYGYSVFTSGTTYNYKCFCGYPSTDGLPTASCKHCGFHIHLICTLGSQFTLDNCCIEHASKMPELYTYSETHARRWQQLLREQYQIVGHDDHFKDAPHDHENTDPIKPVIQGNLSKHMLPDPELVVEDDSDDNNFTMDELMIASVADLLRETQEQSHPLSYPVKAPDYNLKDGPHDDENTDSAKPEIQGNLSRHMLSDPELVAEDDSDNNNLTMDELSLIRPDTNMNREMLHEGIKDVIKRLLKIKEFLKLILHFPDSTALAQYREAIKYPMDLYYVACKVGNREYSGKREILQDLYQIPANCLLFNSDPSHPLRRIALRFRDTVDQLEHRIPDIDVPPMDHITPVTPHWLRKVKEGHGPHQESPGYMCLFFEFDPEKYRRNPACSQLRYETIDELKEHIKTHVLPYSCEHDCGYGTWTKQAYRDHTCEYLHPKTFELVKVLKRAVLAELARPNLSVEEIRSMVFGTHEGKFHELVGVIESDIGKFVLYYTAVEERRIRREKAKAQKEKDAIAPSPSSVADQSDVSTIPSQADKTNSGPPPE